MFAIGELDQWYSAQIGRHGSTQATSCEFGIAHLPDALNRINFMMCKLIEQRAASFTNDLLESPAPWSLECVDKCVTFSAIRRVAGCHGSPFCQFPWFDDNVAGVLAPFAGRFRQLRYDTWEQFRWDVALEKAAVNFWGSQRNLEPVVGFEIRLSDRTWWFPEEKLQRLLGNITDIKNEAAAHPRRLMRRDAMLTVLGRIASATGPVPKLWRHLGGLMSLISCQHFEHYVQANGEMLFLLDRITGELTGQTGRPILSYRLRPGADGLRCWQAFTDASRADVDDPLATAADGPEQASGADAESSQGKFGAGGGWFRMWGSSTVFFFAHEWPADQVAVCNIGELEMLTSSICATLQAQVHEQIFGPSRHYLIEHGDNSGVSDHVNNSMRAHSTGMRFLAERRAQADDCVDRLGSSKHVH